VVKLFLDHRLNLLALMVLMVLNDNNKLLMLNNLTISMATHLKSFLKSQASCHKTDVAIRDAVKERDHHACQGCGFVSPHLDIWSRAAYQVNDSCVACPFCLQCFFLQEVGSHGYGGGVLLFLPEISQNQLNALCHVWFRAMTLSLPDAEQSQTLYQSCKIRMNILEEQLGVGMSQPEKFAMMWMDYNVNAILPENIQKLIKSIRLLPLRASFKDKMTLFYPAA
jgi:intracellular multiplication protein IcmJ